MIETAADEILRSPWGRYTTTGSCIVWCASRTLGGAYLWGRPDARETHAITSLFNEYPRVMDATFDMILDTRAVEEVDGDALKVLTSWMWTNRAPLFERARIFSVIREAPTGFLLAGLLPTIANNRTFRVTTDAKTAFTAVLGAEGVAAAEEIEAIALRLRGVSRELQAVRVALSKRLDTTLDDVAKELRLSPRSLQRLLAKSGTTFHDEVVAMRMSAACELLLSTDSKVAAVASRLGISERAVTMLFRDKTGLTPIEWRTKNRR